MTVDGTNYLLKIHLCTIQIHENGKGTHRMYITKVAPGRACVEGTQEANLYTTFVDGDV